MATPNRVRQWTEVKKERPSPDIHRRIDVISVGDVIKKKLYHLRTSYVYMPEIYKNIRLFFFLFKTAVNSRSLTRQMLGTVERIVSGRCVLCYVC